MRSIIIKKKAKTVMKALLDYSKIEKYIIYNDMTKGSFCKNAGISYSTLKNVENEKGIAVASAQKIAAALHTNLLSIIKEKNHE